MRISDIVIVGIANEPTRNAIVQAVTAEPSVAAVAASWPAAVASDRTAFAEALRQAQDGAAGAKTTVAYKFVSPEYFSVLDIAVVRGRAFTPDERSSTLSVAIVSEATRSLCGRMPMRSARSCASTRIPRPNRGKRSGARGPRD